MSIRLYEITEQYKSLESLETSDELPAEILRDTLDALDGDFRDKATNVALFSRNLLTAAESIEAAAKRMNERATILRQRAESLESYLQLNMQATGITKIESPWFSISLKKCPPRVIIDHEGSIPDFFWRQPEAPPRQIDKKAIAKAIKDGQPVPGAHTESFERLEIKS